MDDSISSLDSLCAQKFFNPGIALTYKDLRSYASRLDDDPDIGDQCVIPETRVEHLGDAGFLKDYHLKFPYVGGAMANGIASIELVMALARGGMLGIFGSAGLPYTTVAAAVRRLRGELGSLPFGVNLIHSPQHPELEEQLVDLFIEQGVRIVEASAFLDLGLSVIRYRFHGIHRDGEGRIVCPNQVIAKVSRVELAQKFMSPPPEKALRILIERGQLSEQEAALARQMPVAQDVTAEADSGGHTDNRPQVTMLPSFLALADEVNHQYAYAQPVRVGAAGGIGSPEAAASAFTMGAAYIVTGTINQACIESGTSDEVRRLLAEASQADITMAPAADMFEMGIRVQVLKRGTMFAMRASKLYELYRNHQSLDELGDKDRAMLESQIFKTSLEQVWVDTMSYFRKVDPKQIERAERDPKHKMALVFRSYLGQSSHWANQGAADRKFDFQIWCGAAMGSFNAWTKGSFLEDARQRKAVTVALNILYGASLVLRRQILRSQGYRIPTFMSRIRPRSEEDLWTLLDQRRTLN